MPDSVVQIEGVGNVQFPASMSEQDITQAAHKLYTEAGAKAIEASPPGMPKPPANPINQDIEDQKTAGLAGVPGGSPHVVPASDTAIGAAGAGLGAAAMIAHPGIATGFVLPSVGSYAINQARKLPGVGPVIDKIPFAEALPWLMGGKGKAAAGAEAAEAEAAPVFSKTRLGPEAPPSELMQSRGLGRPAEVDPAAGLGKNPVAAAEKASPINFPPEEPTPRVSIPKPSAPSSNRADLMDDQSIQQDMRGYLERQDRDVHRLEPLGKSKGEMTEEFNQAIGKPSAPVKYTKTPGVKANLGTPETDDLTPLLQKSLAAVRKKK